VILIHCNKLVKFNEHIDIFEHQSLIWEQYKSMWPFLFRNFACSFKYGLASYAEKQRDHIEFRNKS